MILEVSDMSNFFRCNNNGILASNAERAKLGFIGIRTAYAFGSFEPDLQILSKKHILYYNWYIYLVLAIHPHSIKQL